MSSVYLHYTQRELDRAYQQSEWAPNMAKTLGEYRALSQVQRQITPPEVLRYAQDGMGGVDLFNAHAEGPLIFFLHGGAWKSGDRSMYSFLAQNLDSIDCPLAIPDFPKIQSVGLSAMVDRAGAALRNLLGSRPHYARRGLILAGHSSGAHLAACLATGAAGMDIARQVRSCLLISGIYDMEPVLLSSRRSFVHVTDDEARRLSPLHHTSAIGDGRVTLAYGSRESPEFIRQAESLGDTLERGGHSVKLLMLDDYDHFSILLETRNPTGRLWRALQELTLAGPLHQTADRRHA